MRRLLTGLLLGLVLTSSAAPAVAAGRTAILFVGGLGSTPQGTTQNMALVSAALPDLGYAPSDVYQFSYDPQAWDYAAGLTCQPIAQSEQQLGGAVRGLLEAGYGGVVLVGHSLGGVLAFDLLGAPGVRKVVTVDAPLGGLGSTRALLSDANWSGYCAADDDLRARHASPGWPDHLAALGQSAVARGVGLLVVANADDAVVPIASQSLPGLAGVTWWVQVTDGTGLINHAAVLNTWSTAAALAQWIGPQGQ